MSEHDPARRREVAGLIALLGADVTRFEATVFHFASQLTVDYPDDGVAAAEGRPAKPALSRYRGGQWRVEAIEQEDTTCYWWKLESAVSFRYCNAMNGCAETVDAELLSLAINLIATSHLCIWHFQRGNEQLNHAYAVLHEGLKQHCLEQLQADEYRLGQLLAMID